MPSDQPQGLFQCPKVDDVDMCVCVCVCVCVCEIKRKKGECHLCNIYTVPPVHPVVMGTQPVWGANSLAMPHWSATGPGGTSGAHTH